MAFEFLRCVAKAACNAVGGGVVGDVLFDVIPGAAGGVWKWWAGARSPEQRRQDLAAVAAASPSDIRKEADALALEMCADKPEADRKALALYLSLVPGQVRKSLRRPSDPAGTTCPFQMAPANADDVAALLPTKQPRFKPGDKPLPGVDWELEELLGVGGFGEVWKARNAHLSSVPPVALKFCLESGAGQYLRNEAAVLNQVMRQGRHPGIVTLERTYLSSETPCLEYEYVAGGDLAGQIGEWHRSTPKPTAMDLTRHFLDLCDIVAFAHSMTPPIVHRDLKPANILRHVGADGSCRLKVADFGIGGLATRQAVIEQTRGTNRSMFLATALRGSCTPLYASPQQMRGEPADPRDDVYSLGVIWYQMVTGNLSAGRPGGSKWKTRLVEAGLDEELATLMGDCFEDHLEDRLPDAGALASRLRSLLPMAKPAPPLELRPHPTPAPTLPFPERKAATWERDQERKKRDEELVYKLAELNAFILRNRTDARKLAERAEVLRLLGKHEEAISDATEAIRAIPTLAAAHATRGSCYRLRGQTDLAISDCTRALELEPGNVLAWYNRGEAHRQRKALDKAVADCTRAIELDRAYSWAYGARGAAKRQKGDLRGALEDLDETLRLDPGYVWAWAVRGETHRLMADHDQAIADCSEALKLEPGYALALATRGAAFRQKGDFATAKADLEQALRSKPSDAFAQEQLELVRKKQR
ncbi:MAG: protein kinase [Gemmataceae bacterium]|nr:protein kinase [Gemmataceae bacterium]